VRVFLLLLILLLVLDATIFATPIYMAIWQGILVPGHLLSDFYYSMLLSLYTSTTSSILILLITIPIGYYISRRITRRNLLLPVIMLPSSISPAAVGLLLLLFFTKTPLGLIIDNTLKIVNDPKGIIAAQLFLGIPVGVSYFTALFSSIPRSYEDAALTMGFTNIEYLYTILLPMSTRQVFTGFILVFTRVLGDFGASYIIGGGIWGKTVTLPIYLYLVSQLGGIGVLVITLSIYIVSILVLIAVVYQLESMEGHPQNA